MPRLLVMGVCERVIKDEQSKQFSMVAFLERITVPVAPDNPPPLDLRTPMPWAAAMFWLRLPGDEGKVFEQRFRLVRPDGHQLVEQVLTLEMTERGQHTFLRGDGFPIGVAGEHRCIVSLRDPSDGGEWVDLAEYPIQVVHDIAAPSPPDEP